MSAAGAVAATGVAPSDTDLVAGVRAGDDCAFEELYRRYQRRISNFVRRIVRDDARAEDVTQEAFVSALRRMRATDSEIAFKPWIYEIARNASIDSWRRSSRAEEISINHDETMRPADRARLVGGTGPDTTLLQKERIDHLRRAMDELSQTHHRILVMRELEGLSYREIGEQLDLSRPAVESTLFRARRRLEREYEEIEAGRRCEAIDQAIARISEGIESETDLKRLSRHARGCTACRRRAREMGVEPLRFRRAAARAAAMLPLPTFVRRRFSSSQAAPPPAPDAGVVGSLVSPGAQVGVGLVERAAALMAAVAIGAGGVVLHGPASPHQASSAAGHSRGGAAAPARPRTQEPRAPAAEQRGRAASERTRQWKSRAREGAAARSDKPRSRRPGAGGAPAPALPRAGEIETPAAPSLPATPKLNVAPPPKPALPSAPQVEAPAAPLSLPGAATSAAASVKELGT